MENPIHVLTAQVRAYLVGLKLREPDKFQVYQHFLGQCSQFDISEEAFFKDILRPAYLDINFDELIDDPDPRNEKGTHVVIFGEKIHSLKRLGQVLFENQVRSEDYFEDMSLIKNHVDTLSTGDIALEYAEIYRNERDKNKRFLRIVYHLHPKLPYRIADKVYTTLEDIFEEAFKDKNFYNLIYNDFASGILLIWLNEFNKDQASKLAAGKSYNLFLRSIYSINDKLPFYLGNDLYADPNQIAVKAQKDAPFRKQVYTYIENGQLFTWFEGIGKFDSQAKYLNAISKFAGQKLKGEELVNESVEKLIQIIEPNTSLPIIKGSVDKLAFLGIEAGKQIATPFKLTLEGTGYVKALIFIDTHASGVTLSASQVIFFDLNNQIESIIILNIDPLLMTKDILYEFNIRITTDYQILEIPVQVRTVFPLRSFIFHMTKYSAIGFVGFAFFRLLLGAFTTNTLWLQPKLVTGNFEDTLPSNYPAYIFSLFIFISMIWGAYSLIKKTEKI